MGIIMEAGSIVGIAMIAVGIAVMLCSFWFLSLKKMTADFAVVWEIIGVVLIIVGTVSRLSEWQLEFQGIAEPIAIGIGLAGLFVGYQFSLLISRLMMRNQELAIDLSMLLQEKRRDDRKPGKDLLIILPVRNEEKNIRKVLDRLSQPEIQTIADVLCINDASTDASGRIIDSYPCMQIRNLYGLGYGSALQLGYKYAARHDYQYVIQMDADGQHDPCNILPIYEKLRKKNAGGETPDLVLASRFMDGSSEFRVSVWKKFAFGLFRMMICIVTGRRIADPTTGLQGLGRRAFTYYSGYDHFDHQYPDANMVLQMLLLGFRVTEMPAVMHARTDGKGMHSGAEPAWYMLRMFLSVLAVVFRIQCHLDKPDASDVGCGPEH